MNQHDADMMRRWQAGDAAAFEEMVRRWQGPIGRFLSRLASKPDQVADLCQEVFLRLYVKGPCYREVGVFSTWLYRIAMNVARDAARRCRHIPLPLHGLDPPAPPASDTTSFENQELAEVMRQALAELPEPLRE